MKTFLSYPSEKLDSAREVSTFYHLLAFRFGSTKKALSPVRIGIERGLLRKGLLTSFPPMVFVRVFGIGQQSEPTLAVRSLSYRSLMP